jgi:cobalt-zinc-cadmium resistance protein CzcA
VGQVVEGAARYDMIVRFQEPYRRDPDAIARLSVYGNNGQQVPLALVADIESIESPVQISRESGQRRVVVQANVRGRDLGGFVEEAKNKVAARVKLPPGYHVEWGGQYEHLQSASARLMVVVPITFAVVFILLFITFGALKYAALVFTGIPFAITGGILALNMRGMPFSISAGVGFIALFGVAVLNGVVLVTFINELRRKGVRIAEAVVEGCRTRLRPVLMTATVASIGFLPMALATGKGAEVQKPLATVVIGGIITSTILTLIVLPAMYILITRREERLSESISEKEQ